MFGRMSLQKVSRLASTAASAAIVALLASVTFAALAALTPEPVAAASPHAEAFMPDRTVDGPSRSGGYTLVEALAIGGAEAEEPAQFYEKLGSLNADGDGAGNVYVLDDGNLRVQVFDRNGRFLRSMGQEGEGPGEFKLPTELSVNAAGLCAVFDMGLSRISIFDAQGKLVRDQLADAPVTGIELDDAGSLIVSYAEAPPALVEKFDPTGRSVWKYGAAPEPTERRRQIVRFGIGTVAPRLALAGSGILAASGDAYCIRPLTADGKPLPSFARAFERKKFDLDGAPGRKKGKDGEEGEGRRVVMIKKEVEAGAGDAGGVKTDIQVGNGSEQEFTFTEKDLKRFMPEFEPDIRGLLAFPDGRIWVVTAKRDDDTMVTDEWTSSGEYVTTFEIPAYEGLRVGADGALYAVGHDDEDFPIVHRLMVSAK